MIHHIFSKKNQLLFVSMIASFAWSTLYGDTCLAQQKVMNGSTVKLKSEGASRYLGISYGGKSYYYPLTRGQDSAEPLLLKKPHDNNAVPLKYGDTVFLKATEMKAWPNNWKSYNFLGVFGDGVYYWTEKDKHSHWVITSGETPTAQSQQTGRPVLKGQTIRLKNVFNNQYLYAPNKDDWKLNTELESNNNTQWVIE
ncbi:hypothetical protein [Rubinisphaera italica]|uniref:Uncharacterized protein n=1 Tax=Rubinisphaera italica TaxID=2527969 RepID=A0A5C5XC71_9PLAN|nr:hypothetical protein [Rubinisphaera italica]TWT60737.1 hypothetical protein Pan54_14640 [Rubinisphaera italica]